MSTLAAIGLHKTTHQFNEQIEKIKIGKHASLPGHYFALEAYLEALDKTRHHFRATTFLTSGFWSSPQSAPVVEANRLLAQRVKRAGGVARRIVFIDDRIESHLTRVVEEAVHYAKISDRTFLENLKLISQNLETLASVIETKIVRLSRLPATLEELDPRRFEVACYDDFRIDTFPVDPWHPIPQVTIYPAKDVVFPSLAESFIDLFDSAWNAPEHLSVEEFAVMLKRKIGEYEDRRIDYTASWLELYEDLSKKPTGLLVEEANTARTWLSTYLKKQRQEVFKKYLDVGVCTGRYPMLLGIAPSLIQVTDTIDSDRDCELFLRRRGRADGFRLGDIREESSLDLLSAPYDLISCMLGTVSHFGLHNKDIWDGESGFERGVRNMVKSLRPQGLLLFSSWSKQAVEKGEFLPIYTDSQRFSLTKNTPDRNQVERVLSRSQGAKLYDVVSISPSNALDIYVVKKNYSRKM